MSWIRRLWDNVCWHLDAKPQTRVIWYPAGGRWLVEERWNGFGTWHQSFHHVPLRSAEEAEHWARKRHGEMLQRKHEWDTSTVQWRSDRW